MIWTFLDWRSVKATTHFSGPLLHMRTLYPCPWELWKGLVMVMAKRWGIVSEDMQQGNQLEVAL